MENSTTIILALAIAGIIILYLLTFQPFRKGVKQTVNIPPKTIRKLQASRKEKNEIILKLDYEKDNPKPKRQIFKRGSSGSVSPGLINTEEIIIHTHPAVKNKDRMTNIYETELRERPSLADLKFSKQKKGPELVVTPTGRFLEFNAEKANLNKIKNLEEQAQTQAAQQIAPNSEKNAKKSAELANNIFINETTKAGVEYREHKVRPNKDIKIKTEVK